MARGRAFLTITLMPDGENVNVEGVVGNTGLSYMMLELAKDAIRLYGLQHQTPLTPLQVIHQALPPNGNPAA